MRRLYAIGLGIGVAALLIAIPLWHVTRSDSSACQIHNTYPCDPRQYLPYGTVAVGLTVFGIMAVLTTVAVIIGLGLVALARQVRAQDRQG